VTIWQASDPAVRAVFKAYTSRMRVALLEVRAWIFVAARENDVEIVETLKWGQLSYLPKKQRMGTTVRIDAVKGETDRYAAYFHCQTTLISEFKQLYPRDLKYEGERAIVFTLGKTKPGRAFKHCVGLALTYHARKRAA
jgi:hypothetical protein